MSVHVNTFKDVEYTVQTTSNACPWNAAGVGNLTAADIINVGIKKILDGSYFPANNRYYYIEAMISTLFLCRAQDSFPVYEKAFQKVTSFLHA